MYAPNRPLFPALLAGILLWVPATGSSESVLVHQGKASTSLDFRIIIPPFVRVLENRHPLLLEFAADETARAEQHLVVESNMKQGFCISLRRTAPHLGTWELQTAFQSEIQLFKVADGYQLCGTRPGQYSVLLQHRFGRNADSTSALKWSVRTDISAI